MINDATALEKCFHKIVTFTKYSWEIGRSSSEKRLHGYLKKYSHLIKILQPGFEIK